MKAQRLIIIIIIVGVFLAFMTTYTVRFNERAVVTTLGKAGEGSVITTPGLRLKLPPPIQEVTRYDARIRFIQSDEETQQTAEGAQVILTTFLTWRVDDPLKFYRRFSGAGDNERDHYREAERILKSKLRSAASAVSRYRLDQLLSSTAEGSRLAQVEADMLQQLTATAGQGGAPGSEAPLAEYGIKPEAVGVSSLGLPQNTTTSVFERMKSARLKIANDTVSQGGALASTIRSSAEADAKKIESFAQQLATRIRNQGDIEAAQFLKQLNDNPQLAVFLENMKFMRQALGRTTTLVLPTSMPGFELFRTDAQRTFKAGEIPGMGVEVLTRPVPRSGGAGSSRLEDTSTDEAASPSDTSGQGGSDQQVRGGSR